MSTFLLLSGSSRKGGNSDTATAFLAAQLARRCEHRAFPPVQSFFVRDHPVLHCNGCNSCASSANMMAHPHSPWSRCPLSQQDASPALLLPLEQAQGLCIISPIQNYHLPAGLKALLDRLQPWFTASPKNPVAAELPIPAYRPCFTVLVAGRTRGEKLFEGSLLTLRYALAPLGFALQPPLLLRGIDGPADLANNTAALEALDIYAAGIAAVLAQEHP